MEDPILLEHAAPHIRRLGAIARELNMSISQLAIAFMRDQAGVSSLVLGAETPEQVTENLSYFDTPRLDAVTLFQLEAEFANVNIPAIMQVLSRPKK